VATVRSSESEWNDPFNHEQLNGIQKAIRVWPEEKEELQTGSMGTTLVWNVNGAALAKRYAKS